MFTSRFPAARAAIVAIAMTAVTGSGLALTGAQAQAGSTIPQGSFKGKVTATGGLVARTAPSSHAASARTGYAKGTVITIGCALNGTTVKGNHRWYRIRNTDSWVSARYVSNIGKAPYDCTAGDWTYRTTTGLTVREGPSTKDRKIGRLGSGKEIDTRWVAGRGQSVNGNRKWIAVNVPGGNRGWVAAPYTRQVN